MIEWKRLYMPSQPDRSPVASSRNGVSEPSRFLFFCS